MADYVIVPFYHAPTYFAFPQSKSGSIAYNATVQVVAALHRYANERLANERLSSFTEESSPPPSGCDRKTNGSTHGSILEKINCFILGFVPSWVPSWIFEIFRTPLSGVQQHSSAQSKLIKVGKPSLQNPKRRSNPVLVFIATLDWGGCLGFQYEKLLLSRKNMNRQVCFWCVLITFS